ncbi:hypothetical protein COO60DRAFT_486797 [Scenedesmus sp. NREL 46B-D3]|nr:hypothetical protein COO60DRAFT_486797 [Scenedesmus sp. NREL 46B-D3]
MAKLPKKLLYAFREVPNRYCSGSCRPYGVLSPLFASLSAAAAPCSSIHSSSSTFSHARSASNQAPLMRMQQQQQDQQGSSHSSRSPWVKLLAGGAAAAAAAGWAVWSENDAEMRAQALAEESSRAGLSRCSGATQGAVASCYAGPLVALLHGTWPTQAQLQEMTASVTQDALLLTPWELVNSLWGLAMFGAELSQQQMQALAAAAASQMGHMTAYQAIVAAWALLLLCSSMEQLCSSCWLQLLSKLQGSGLQEYDEAAVLYLLHAAMQRAGLQDAAAAAGAFPRASEQEVLQLLGQLPKAVKARVAAAYKDYVPFQQYIEGPFLVIMHIAKALPSQVNAAAAAAAGSSRSSSSSSSSPYEVAYGGFSAADGDAASTLVANSSLLSKLRRNLYFGWRSDELLDRHQDNLNQASWAAQALQQQLLPKHGTYINPLQVAYNRHCLTLMLCSCALTTAITVLAWLCPPTDL